MKATDYTLNRREFMAKSGLAAAAITMPTIAIGQNANGP